MLDTKIRNYVLSKLDSKSAGDNEVRDWIIEKSKIAGQRKFVTHAPKLIHPDARVSAIIAEQEGENDGYIRTANVEPFLDSVGNASAMPVTELLNLDIDGKPLYKHLKENTAVAEEFRTFIGADGEDIQKNFLKVFEPSSDSVTDERVRQVYFPVGDGYILITPLMSSPVMQNFMSILNNNWKYNNNPLTSEAKNPVTAGQIEAKNGYLEGGYWTLPGLVGINYGGDKPQNISSMNLKTRKFKLIKSLPPELRYRKIRIPYADFFKESVYAKSERYACSFRTLDKIYKLSRNNIDIRNKRDAYMEDILEKVGADIASVRYEISLNNKGEYKGRLSEAEYMMLYEDEKRYESDEWLMEISAEFARWFLGTYKDGGIIDKPITFGDGEYRAVRDFAFSNKEVFIQ